MAGALILRGLCMGGGRGGAGRRANGWTWGGKASDILGGIAPMRWLMIGFIVSLGALLIAAAGVARHIWLHHRKLRTETLAAPDAVPETDLEVEP